MSSPTIASHYARLLTRWPKDRLRPAERTLQSVFRTRMLATPSSIVTAADSTSTASKVKTSNEAPSINAAYLLLDDTFARQFPLSEATMKPASNPTHYTNLQRELEEMPDRSFLSNVWNRVSHMFRMQ
ncbi:Hypothetical protein R9X50_00702100 [Acrodontium crateriforme]|uniref:Uncharacterized protein n=1 Tax=Acrodontium crateriforme TaxID=150365 RepID=A0AAQ3MAA4_9PEZI|nr:Hypothetical protein R9X50_00702100 [Acrodontium crateriforme]